MNIDSPSSSGLAYWKWALIGTGVVLGAVITFSLGSRLLSCCAAGVARCRKALGQLTPGPEAVLEAGPKPNLAASPALIDLESRERSLPPLGS